MTGAQTHGVFHAASRCPPPRTRRHQERRARWRRGTVRVHSARSTTRRIPNNRLTLSCVFEAFEWVSYYESLDGYAIVRHQGAARGRMMKERTARPMGLLHHYRSSIAPYGALGTSARRFRHAYLSYEMRCMRMYIHILVLPQERSSVGATDGLKQAFPQCE